MLKGPYPVIARSIAAVSTSAPLLHEPRFAHNTHGLFLVTESTIPTLDTQALANDIVARIEREFSLANTYGPRLADLPITLFQPGRETPIVVLRRVLKSLYSSAFSA